jgi:alkyl hydroperoxide reductase subunit AhpC
MALQLGDTAPDFQADTTEGPISFHDWIGDSWVVLFSHPKDFTPICTTELGYMARIKPDFDSRGVKIIGLSVDPLDKHEAWSNDIEETQGHAPNYPMIADVDFAVSKAYPMTTGRNFDEVLRVIDSLQLTAKHKVSTPVNWKNGEDVVIAGSVSDDQAREIWPDGWDSPKPYIRIVKQPTG